jgi:hypothetical protein
MWMPEPAADDDEQEDAENFFQEGLEMEENMYGDQDAEEDIGMGHLYGGYS